MLTCTNIKTYPSISEHSLRAQGARPAGKLESFLTPELCIPGQVGQVSDL